MYPRRNNQAKNSIQCTYCTGRVHTALCMHRKKWPPRTARAAVGKKSRSSSACSSTTWRIRRSSRAWVSCCRHSKTNCRWTPGSLAGWSASCPHALAFPVSTTVNVMKLQRPRLSYTSAWTARISSFSCTFIWLSTQQSFRLFPLEWENEPFGPPHSQRG